MRFARLMRAGTRFSSRRRVVFRCASANATDKADAVDGDDTQRSWGLGLTAPARLLNHVAQLYTSAPRVVVEFVDNAIDDAAPLYRAADGRYSRPIAIDVYLDAPRREVRIVDNCRGMDRATLRRVTTNVGDSLKRTLDGVARGDERGGDGAPPPPPSRMNGRFGFGMQSFRAIADGLRVRSRAAPHAPLLEIAVAREQEADFRLARVGDADDAASAVPRTGTEVALVGAQPRWLARLSRAGLARDLESHFERVLARGNLRIAVHDAAAAVDGVVGESEDGALVLQPPSYDEEAFGECATTARVPLGGGQCAEVCV